MSDGQPWDDATPNVNLILKKSYMASKIQFFACGFGGHGRPGEFSELEKLTKLFKGGQMTQAPTVEELKQSMLYILRADNSGPG